MLRIVSLAILPGMLLAACASWVSADTTKQKYSNRPVGYTVPTPYYGTPMAPRFVVPPVAQVRVQPPQRVETTDLSRISSSVAMAPPAPQVGDKTVFILREPSPEVNVNDELDAFYARMAKIQLEKHKLPEALALMENIKSQTFKVRTIISLAEYVSRDKNYQSEAEQLYRLALIGIDALDKKQPFKIDISGVTVNIPPLEQRVIPDPPVAPVPQQIDDFSVDEPVQPAQPDEVQPNNPPRQPVPLEPSDVGQNGGDNDRRPPPPPPDEGSEGASNGGLVTSPPGNKPIIPVEMFEDDGPVPPITPPNSTTTTKPTQDPPPASLNGITIDRPSGFVRPPIEINLGDPEKEEETKPVVVPKSEEKVEPPPKPATSSGQRRQAIILPDEN